MVFVLLSQVIDAVSGVPRGAVRFPVGRTIGEVATEIGCEVRKPDLLDFGTVGSNESNVEVSEIREDGTSKVTNTLAPVNDA